MRFSPPLRSRSAGQGIHQAHYTTFLAYMYILHTHSHLHNIQKSRTPYNHECIIMFGTAALAYVFSECGDYMDMDGPTQYMKVFCVRVWCSNPSSPVRIFFPHTRAYTRAYGACVCVYKIQTHTHTRGIRGNAIAAPKCCLCRLDGTRKIRAYRQTRANGFWVTLKLRFGSARVRVHVIYACHVRTLLKCVCVRWPRRRTPSNLCARTHMLSDGRTTE